MLYVKLMIKRLRKEKSYCFSFVDTRADSLDPELLLWDAEKITYNTARQQLVNENKDLHRRKADEPNYFKFMGWNFSKFW